MMMLPSYQRQIVCGLIAITVASALACTPSEETAPDGTPMVPESEIAPEFTLERLEGGEVTLSDLRGKTVIIDFWATWCPPCEFQVPELNAFYDAHQASGEVEVLGISVDTEGPDVVGQWTTEKEVRYPILMGNEDLARRYGALGFPTLVIISPDGSIDSRHVGLIEREQLEEALERQRTAAST
jgi:thiol-disulfide isomerase/thioredoxin